MSAPPADPTPDPALLRQGWAILAAGTAARLILGLTTGLVEDEPYYWSWSQAPALGYFDHPPMIAWVIALSDALFGATTAGVRAAPILLSALPGVLLLPRSRDPRLLALLLSGMPLYTLGGVMATPDVPMLAGWALAMRGALDRSWITAGIGAGVAGLSKYTGWGLWPLLLAAELHGAWLASAGVVSASVASGNVVIGNVSDRNISSLAVRLRATLRAVPWRGLAAGIGVTLLILAPNLWWNAQHGWISVAFQLNHGLSTDPGARAPKPGNLPEFLGAQILLVSPVLSLWVLRWGWAGLRGLIGGLIGGQPVEPGAGRADRIAWWLAIPPLVFFSLAASRTPAEANWAAMAYLGACLGVAGGPGAGGVAGGGAGGFAAERWRRGAYAGAGVGLALSALVALHLYLPLVESDRDPTARLGVGRILAQSVRAWEVAPVYTERYQEAAILRFYAGIEAYALPGGRTDQFDIWPRRWPDRPEDRALFVRPLRSGDAAPIDAFCDQRGGANVVRQNNADGTPFARWQVYEVSGCRPLTP